VNGTICRSGVCLRETCNYRVFSFALARVRKIIVYSCFTLKIDEELLLTSIVVIVSRSSMYQLVLWQSRVEDKHRF
jgi:hypothetical protein